MGWRDGWTFYPSARNAEIVHERRPSCQTNMNAKPDVQGSADLSVQPDQAVSNSETKDLVNEAKDSSDAEEKKDGIENLGAMV